MSANGTPNTSCSTNASRSAGVSASSTTSRASPTESASSASCSGSSSSAAHHRIRDVHRRLLASRAARAQHVQAHPPDDRRQPGLHVLDAPGILVANPQPGLLKGIVGLAHRPEHPVGDRAEMRSVLLEPFGQPLALVHRHPATSRWYGDVGGQGRRRQEQEEHGSADLAVADSDVGGHGADEVQDEADRRSRPERRHGEAGEKSDGAGGQQRAERDHPSLGRPAPGQRRP